MPHSRERHTARHTTQKSRLNIQAWESVSLGGDGMRAGGYSSQGTLATAQVEYGRREERMGAGRTLTVGTSRERQLIVLKVEETEDRLVS